MVKDQVRAIGIDDAPFKFSEEDVLVVGSVVRAPNYLEGVLSTRVQIDGTDATENIIEMVDRSKFKDQAKIIFIDGAAFGGFNLIDLEKVNKRTKIPVISVSREKPDFDEIEKAIKHHFEEWEEKYKLVKKGEIFEVETEYKPIYIQKEGIELEEVERLIDLFTQLGRLPEPIRISHIIASGIVKGESKGKA
ncbi:MAG: DUF99 family protein [Candidatus Thermoplasmatota archaeon]|nr:DUF99 family protein [Candidatus Thermoplasmatota archaeon]